MKDKLSFGFNIKDTQSVYIDIVKPILLGWCLSEIAEYPTTDGGISL